MAKEKSNNERTEREFQLDINQAVANTEGEIFEDALDDKPLDNDDDTSLEEMGDGLEGDDLEDEEGSPGEDTDVEDQEAEEAENEGEEQAEGDEPEVESAESDEEKQPRDERGRFDDQQRPDRRDVPLRAERERRRQAEERAAENDRKLAEALGRIDELSRRVNAPTPRVEQPRPPKPDIFADPDGYERWIMEEAERKSQAYVNQQMANYQEQETQRLNANFNQSLGEAAQGERSEELDAAYGRLKSLDPQNPSHVAIVQGIFRAPDPAAALFRWWDRNGGTQYRASEEYQNRVQEKLDRAEQEAERFRSLLPGRQNSRQRSQQPRHETRLPESLRRSPPSLNSARGGQRQEVQDPDMMDDSDDAVMRFAMRR